MKDMQNAVNAAFNGMVKEGKIEAIIEKQIEGTVKSIIEEALRSYSDFGKSLSEKIKNDLKFDFKEIGFDSYNHFIVKTIKAKIDKEIHIAGKEKIEKLLDDMLVDCPKEMKISELVEKFKEKVFSDNCNEAPDDECTCLVEQSGSFIYIGFSGTADKPKYDCDYRIGIYKDKIHSLRFGKSEISREFFLGTQYGFEKILFQLYATGAKIIIDEDNIDLEYNCEED
jgi:hypothetical protein